MIKVQFNSHINKGSALLNIEFQLMCFATTHSRSFKGIGYLSLTFLCSCVSGLLKLGGKNPLVDSRIEVEDEL